MSLSTADLEKIAHLARLQFSAQDAQNFSQALTNIFTLIDQLNRVDTSVPPLAHSIDNVIQPLRADVVTETDQSELLQSIAPQVQDKLYLVPKVIE